MTRVSHTSLRVFLHLVALGLTVLSPGIGRSDDAPTARKATPLDGAWQQVEQKNGNAQEYSKPPDDTVMTIYVTGGRFVWTIVKGNKIVAAAGGKYTVEKDKYTESIEYVYGDGVPESFIGSSFDFTWKVEGDTWHKLGVIKVNGQDFKIDEKWERCK